MAGKVGRRIYKTVRWKKIRLEVFRRDGWRCRSCGRRSGLECDHINRIEDGGGWFDRDNLRTLCRSCHIRVGRDAASKPVSPERLALRALTLPS